MFFFKDMCLQESLADESGHLQDYLNNQKVQRASRWDIWKNPKPEISHFLKAAENYTCYVNMTEKHTLPNNAIIQVGYSTL